MANKTGAPKSFSKKEKGSRLASLKKALFGGGKKKSMKAASKAAPAKGKNGAHSAASKGSETSLSKPDKLKKTPPVKIETAPSPHKPVPAKLVKVAKTAKGSRRSADSAPTRAQLEAAGESVCREVACEGLSTTGGYCRMHYIKNWKKIKRKELILKEGKLNQYIEELVAKYPDKYIEAIRQDLAADKDFAKVIYDLDLDEGVDDFEVEGESIDSVIDNIKRDFEDEGEGTF